MKLIITTLVILASLVIFPINTQSHAGKVILEGEQGKKVSQLSEVWRIKDSDLVYLVRQGDQDPDRRITIGQLREYLLGRCK